MHQSALPAPSRAPIEDEPLLAVQERLLDGDPEFDHYSQTSSRVKPLGLVDVLFAEGQPPDPEAAFNRLRWGGQIVYASREAIDRP